MNKPTRATRFIHAAANRMRADGVTVDCDSAYSTVAIDAPGQDGVFMQGEEADQFDAAVSAMCKRYPSLDRDTAELAFAEQYADCLFH